MWIFETDVFVARGENLPDWMVIQSVISYLISSACYYAILVRLYVCYKNRSWASRLFATFLFSCATVQALEALLYYYPIYRLFVISATLLASLAIVSFALTSKITSELAKLTAIDTIIERNQQLEAELAATKKNEGMLVTINVELEKEVKTLERHIEMQGWFREKNSDLERLKNTITDIRKMYHGPS